MSPLPASPPLAPEQDRLAQEDPESPRGEERGGDADAAPRAHHLAGSDAPNPASLTPKAWKQIALRVKGQIQSDSLSVVAGGVAFWTFMAVFPAIAAVVALWGLFADPRDVEPLLSGMSLPAGAVGLLKDRLNDLAGSANRTLSLGLVVSLLLALWSANKGTKATVQALNVAYEEREDRGFIHLNLLTLCLTLAAVTVFVVAALLVIVAPALMGHLGLEEVTRSAISLGRWPLLAILMAAAAGALYRLGPSRSAPRWTWTLPGALTTGLLWVLGSSVFSFYVSNFGNYEKTYGSLGGVVILMLWFYMSAYVLLLGAEINAEAEHQTLKDSTVGEREPIGERGAYHADHVPRASAS